MVAKFRCYKHLTAENNRSGQWHASNSNIGRLKQRWHALRAACRPSVAALRNTDPKPLSGDHGGDLTQLLGGIPAGFVNRSEGFVEFLATPGSVSNALVAIGPLLDNAVNYYGNHFLNSTTHQIAKDAATACKSISQEIGRSCQLPADKRGELIGGIWVDVLLAEAGGLVVKVNIPR
jgi:hypothetical protein